MLSETHFKEIKTRMKVTPIRLRPEGAAGDIAPFPCESECGCDGTDPGLGGSCATRIPLEGLVACLDVPEEMAVAPE